LFGFFFNRPLKTLGQKGIENFCSGKISEGEFNIKNEEPTLKVFSINHPLLNFRSLESPYQKRLQSSIENSFPPYKALYGTTSLPMMRMSFSIALATERAHFFPILFLSQ